MPRHMAKANTVSIDEVQSILKSDGTEMQTTLNLKVPSHAFILDGVVYEWYDGNYYKKVSEKKTGDSFGELALLVEEGMGLRAATIRCEEEVHFATLSKEEYVSSLKRIEARLVQEQVEFLNHIPCFKTQSKKALLLFTKYLKKLDFTFG